MANKRSVPGYHCRSCGEWHGEMPFHYRSEAPYVYYDVPARERKKRCDLTSDQCVIDEKFFFIVGNLEIPVLDHLEHFSWDVWVSLSVQNFLRASELWTMPGRESEPSYFGWFSTLLPGYPETLNLKTQIHTREVGRRPFVELEPTDHPLAVEQRRGITLARVQEIAELVLHQDD